MLKSVKLTEVWHARPYFRACGAWARVDYSSSGRHPFMLPTSWGEIELICVNPGTNPPTYRIRVRIYRECEGIEQPSTITVRYQSSSCGVNQTITLNRTRITDFTPLYPGQQSLCQNSSSPDIGWEEHVYESSSIQLHAYTA